MNDANLLAYIAQANNGREPQRLRIKYARMAADNSAFYRGTASLFYELLPQDSTLQRAPLAWICGDLHLENFGSYLGDNGLAYFDINDFDEAALAPLSYECIRFLTHLAIAAPSLGISQRALRLESRLALDHFVAAIARGKSYWVERRLATGAVRKLLRKAAARSQRDLLDERTLWLAKERRLKVDSKRALPLLQTARRDVKRMLSAAINTLGGEHGSSGEFRLLDAARRLAGVGSLGLERYVLLVAGDGSRNGARLLDLKVAKPSCLAVRLSKIQPAWSSEATRIVSLQRRLQANSPALLSASNYADRSFVLKELQPTQDRLKLPDLDGVPERRREALKTLAQLSAWSMLRASGWDGAAPGERLTACMRESGWQKDVLAVSTEMSKIMTDAWQTFRKAQARLSAQK